MAWLSHRVKVKFALARRAHPRYEPSMEQLIREVEAYARQHNVRPEWVLRQACSYPWHIWDAWCAGTAQALPRTQAKVRAWMEANG